MIRNMLVYDTSGCLDMQCNSWARERRGRKRNQIAVKQIGIETGSSGDLSNIKLIKLFRVML